MASFLGIDVSGLSLDALVRPEGIKISVPNDSAGFVALEKSLRGLNIKRILLEATGGYEREVMRFLLTTTAENPWASALSREADLRSGARCTWRAWWR